MTDRAETLRGLPERLASRAWNLCIDVSERIRRRPAFTPEAALRRNGWAGWWLLLATLPTLLYNLAAGLLSREIRKHHLR